MSIGLDEDFVWLSSISDREGLGSKFSWEIFTRIGVLFDEFTRL